ncbi:MAG: hypothetical protein ACREGJ_04155 [Candidatus Saccharimonadales bacterium]
MSLDHHPHKGERATRPQPKYEREAPTTISSNQGSESDTRNFKPNKRSRFNQASGDYPDDVKPKNPELAKLFETDEEFRNQYLEDYLREKEALEAESKTSRKLTRRKLLTIGGGAAGLAGLVAAGIFGMSKLSMGGSEEPGPGSRPVPTATAEIEPTPTYETVESLKYPTVDHLPVASYDSFEDVFEDFADLESYGLNKDPQIFYNFIKPECDLVTLDSSTNNKLNDERLGDYRELVSGDDEETIRKSSLIAEANYTNVHFITQKYGVDWEELGYEKSTWFSVLADRNVVLKYQGKTEHAPDYQMLKFTFVKEKDPETQEERWYVSGFDWPNEHDYEAAGLEPPAHAPGIDGSPEVPTDY